MAFDFDAAVERRGTHSKKWDQIAAATGVAAADGIPMWIADMDFPAPPPVRASLAAAVAHGVFGYFGEPASWRDAVAGWALRRHGWEIDTRWITPSGGVCGAMGIAIRAFSEPGEGVALFPPLYTGFSGMVRATGRRIVEAPLAQMQGRFAMDLEALARDLPEDVRIVMLCNPHNPGGTVWTPAEIRALAEFCAERGLVLVSDEVWRDLVYPEARFTPAALAAPDCADRIVTLSAPSKTFNTAGLRCAEVVISDEELRRRYRREAHGSEATAVNSLGFIAAEAAYAGGASWLDALLPYLAANRDRFAAGVAEAIPGARPMALQSTYLAWVDFAGTGLAQDEAMRRLRDVARIGVNEGPSFGPGGERCARFNFACPRATLDAALDRLAAAFADLRG
ncbi:MAG: MalY/PatB family protein [Rubrimonas sp.]|uniref:MalY/PatB family protein n=1 Tax=Rubrimonas sp. TaxID=2036015 RepID=UPI002FDDDA25